MPTSAPIGGAPSGSAIPVWVRAVGVGVAAGVLSGLFGVGGGIVMVPLLVAWFALDQRRASGTSLLAIVPIATASTAGYAATGSLDPVAGVALILGGIVGGQVGTWLLPRVPIPTLQLWFGLLSLATAARLVFGGSDSALLGVGGALEVVLLGVVGLIAGVLAGLLGVGGGIIMVPAMVLLTGADAATARGTSLMVVIVTALTATVRNVRNGLVDVRIAVIAGLAGVPAGIAGAALGQWIPDRLALALFGCLLVVSGVQMIVRSRRHPVG